VGLFGLDKLDIADMATMPFIAKHILIICPQSQPERKISGAQPYHIRAISFELTIESSSIVAGVNVRIELHPVVKVFRSLIFQFCEPNIYRFAYDQAVPKKDL
jgi:hypothetical protein